ncbi:hypothetical protein CUMW_012530, partial [Citrus unshiu]
DCYKNLKKESSTKRIIQVNISGVTYCVTVATTMVNVDLSYFYILIFLLIICAYIDPNCIFVSIAYLTF